MNNKILILFFLFLIYCINNASKSAEYFTQVTPNKDWLEEIFDYRQIITIPSRLQYVQNFAKTFEIKPTIFNAILKNDISYNNIHRLKLGEIACALSQEQTLKNFIKSDHKSFIMFEDDNISFNNQLYTTSGLQLQHVKTYIKNSVKSLPDDWDVLYLGRCWDNCSKNKKINKYWYKTHRTL